MASPPVPVEEGWTDPEMGSDSSVDSRMSRRWRGDVSNGHSNGAGSPDAGPSASEQSKRADDDEVLKWSVWEKQSSYDRMRTTVLGHQDGTSEAGVESFRPTDILNHDPALNEEVLRKFFRKSLVQDNEDFLTKIRSRLDKVNLKQPTVEVRYENLTLEAMCRVGSQLLPTLPNQAINAVNEISTVFNLPFLKKRQLTILKDVSGILKPGRIALLLGPPGSGKTSFLQALAGKLEHGLTAQGSITYNGHTFDEFVPLKTAAYVGQSDLHSGEFTVKETLDVAARYQGVGSRYDLLAELLQREKELGIHPDPDVDFVLKSTAFNESSHDMVSRYIIKILGLEVCADSLVGDAMRRGISGGQKKRLTIGELLVGPSRTLFMDEITNGLDTSTAFQIVSCLGHFAHVMDMTILTALLQPSPEIYELFDDVILLSEGQIAYHGPRENIEEFFASCGFKCPLRKGIPDFLQEVTSRKDQQQYWADKSKPYKYVSVSAFSEAFKSFHVGIKMFQDLAIPFDKTTSHSAALVYDELALSHKEEFKVTFQKEILFLKRNSFIYIFKTVQMMIQGAIISTVFLRTEMVRKGIQDSQKFSGALFADACSILFTGFADVTLTTERLPVYYKQRDMKLFPAWGFALSTFVTRLPFSPFETIFYVAFTYYSKNFAPNISRFLKVLLIYIAGHQLTTSLFRTIAGVCRTQFLANSLGSVILVMLFTFGGFILPRNRFKDWWLWGYFSSPLSWILISTDQTEFLAPQWNKKQFPSDNHTIGYNQLKINGVYTESYWYWISLGVITGQILLFNILFIFVMTYWRAPGKSRTVMSEETLAEMERNLNNGYSGPDTMILKMSEEPTPPESKEDIATSIREGGDGAKQLQRSPKISKHPSSRLEKLADTQQDTYSATSTAAPIPKSGMVLPFQPHSISFNNINYFVDMPSRGEKLQLLKGITGAFRPGVLAALVGVSGAGKSTLMDVLLGRKTRGHIEGEIRISGFLKNQKTFARVSGYCEQTDVHSPSLTVRESLEFSALLRLNPSIPHENKMLFVDEVMELVEMENLKNSIVGLPDKSGLSIGERKRLTIAVELVANPSIIFMDEPTSGLDARAAAIVMRTVRNTVDTGRTVVCTIHQPSIDIFESFDELLLLKQGGQAIYSGPLGRYSQDLVRYLENIEGVPKIKTGTNPATWMLEVTTPAMEKQLRVDFAEIFVNSSAYERTAARVEELSTPAFGAKDLYFEHQYAQPTAKQLRLCLWKQRQTYWRTPEYNNVRFIFTLFLALFMGSMFWRIGQKRETQANVVDIMAATYTAGLMLGILMSIQVQPLIAIERGVFYRERAAGMYSSIPLAFSQILIEVPYTFVQTLAYAAITYSMVDLEWTAKKFFLYNLYIFLSVLIFVYYGMMTMAISPSAQVAAVISAFFFNIWSVFSGFVIRKPEIPVWWAWYYWANPLAWYMYGSMVAQFGDLDDVFIFVHGESEKLSIQRFIRVNFGFRDDWQPYVIAVMSLFILLFAGLYIFAVRTLNFQQR